LQYRNRRESDEALRHSPEHHVGNLRRSGCKRPRFLRAEGTASRPERLAGGKPRVHDHLMVEIEHDDPRAGQISMCLLRLAAEREKVAGEQRRRMRQRPADGDVLLDFPVDHGGERARGRHVAGARGRALGLGDALAHVEGEHDERNRDGERERGEIVSDRERTALGASGAASPRHQPADRAHRSINPGHVQWQRWNTLSNYCPIDHRARFTLRERATGIRQRSDGRHCGRSQSRLEGAKHRMGL
jgi:hypothetical protein